MPLNKNGTITCSKCGRTIGFFCCPIGYKAFCSCGRTTKYHQNNNDDVREWFYKYEELPKEDLFRFIPYKDLKPSEKMYLWWIGLKRRFGVV